MGPRVSLPAIRRLVADPGYDNRVLAQQFLLCQGGDEQVFSHALFQDGAYASLLHARRRQSHLLAAQWIEPRDVALAAEHFERAEDARATAAYLRASELLANVFHYAQALELVESGLRHAENRQPTFPLKLARSRLLLEIGRSAEATSAGAVAVKAARRGAEHALGLFTMASGIRIVDRPDEGWRCWRRRNRWPSRPV